MKIRDLPIVLFSVIWYINVIKINRVIICIWIICFTFYWTVVVSGRLERLIHTTIYILLTYYISAIDGYHCIVYKIADLRSRRTFYIE